MHAHTAQCSTVIYHEGEKHLGSSREAASLRLLCKLSAKMDISHNQHQFTAQSAAPGTVVEFHMGGKEIPAITSHSYSYLRSTQAQSVNKSKGAGPSANGCRHVAQ